MDIIEIHYSFNLENQRREVFDLVIDAYTLELINDFDHELPPWTHLEFYQCSHCNLSSEIYPNCPVAVNLTDIIGRFDNIFSYDEIDLEVISNKRHVYQHTTAQRGISSLLGLLFATSSCPYTAYLKPMARFHLPMASPDETIFRAVGMYLLGQYFLRKEGKGGEFDLSGLTQICSDLHLLNTMIAKRITSVAQTDSSMNAVVLLDIFTDLMPSVIENNLEEVRHLFDSYFLYDTGENI